MKSITVITLLISSIVVLSAVVSAVNVTWGTIGYYDRLVARDVIIKDSKWFGKHKEIIQYPPKNHQSFVLLSAIRVIDYGGKKNFGYATLLKGGPGYRNSTVELRSQSGKSLNITLEYFGR